MSRRTKWLITAISLSLCVLLGATYILAPSMPAEQELLVNGARTHSMVGPAASPSFSTHPIPDGKNDEHPQPYRPAYTRLESEKDLFALYRELATSRRYADLDIAKRILGECQQISSLNNVYRGVAEGREDKIGPWTFNDAQRAAAIEIVSRCAGFNGWQSGAFRSEIGILSLKESDAAGFDGDALRASSRNEIPSDQALREILIDGDPYVVSRLQEVLLNRWFAASGTPRLPEEDQLARVAFDQVQCALGADCSADSLLALTGCFFHASFCGLSYFDQLTGRLNPMEATRADDFRVRIAGAIQRREWSAFGL